jgi:hypothetical protein
MTNTYTTLSLVQAEIRADTAFSSSTTPTADQVTTWIEEASKEVELRTNQLFASTVVTSQYFDYDGDEIFRFPQVPLLSIETFRYNINDNAQTPSWVTLQEGLGYNYLLYLEEAEAEFISGANATNKVTPLSGKKKFCIDYTYGYASTPLEVQRLTTLMVAKRVIYSLVNSQANVEGGDIQVGTIRVSDPSNYSLGYVKSISSEVDDLFNKLGLQFKNYRIMRSYA